MIRDQYIFRDDRWLAIREEQRRAIQGLIKATGEAEAFIKSRLADQQGNFSNPALTDILRWIELCRDLGVLPSDQD